MSFGRWPHDRMASSLRGQPLITGVLEQFTTSGWRSLATTTPIWTRWHLRDGSPEKTHPDHRLSQASAGPLLLPPLTGSGTRQSQGCSR